MYSTSKYKYTAQDMVERWNQGYVDGINSAIDYFYQMKMNYPDQQITASYVVDILNDFIFKRENNGQD